MQGFGRVTAVAHLELTAIYHVSAFFSSLNIILPPDIHRTLSPLKKADSHTSTPVFLTARMRLQEKQRCQASRCGQMRPGRKGAEGQ